jgi:putative FmdB family regulatory protein
MPLYEYRCPHCNKTREILQSMDDTSDKHCPNIDCHKAVMVKLFPTKTSFIFKGSGFYKNDYGKGEKK